MPHDPDLDARRHEAMAEGDRALADLCEIAMGLVTCPTLTAAEARAQLEEDWRDEFQGHPDRH